MRAKTKDVAIGDTRFQIGKMEVEYACWVLNLFMATEARQMMNAKPNSNGTPAPEPPPQEQTREITEEQAGNIVASGWVMVGADLPTESYRQIQSACLRATSMYLEDGSPMPLKMADGRWTASGKRFADDLKTVNQLIIESLKFNLSPFFLEDALNAPPQTTAAGRPSIASR